MPRTAVSNSGTYTVQLEGHNILVMNVPGGKGYCPTDLIEKGDIQEAARIAKLAFDRRL